ncbi:hypothetical protein KFL_012210030 [Klebsormidium nitens]|uniref:Uncharacterized protein n=1 Tax=Klebsormidium nitens TaxID=105231 RepID=A0A1Y1IQG5_KLENI|nr:hypothetical protein KFL_012210030 [Klebsormidium nitens]|eukprot:GAQ92954.1 hypothetical protein KFL_012210030 [Klebsormidium nitens]
MPDFGRAQLSLLTETRFRQIYLQETNRSSSESKQGRACTANEQGLIAEDLSHQNTPSRGVYAPGPDESGRGGRRDEEGSGQDLLDVQGEIDWKAAYADADKSCRAIRRAFARRRVEPPGLKVLFLDSLAVQALLVKKNPDSHLLLSPFELVVCSQISLAEAVQAWKATLYEENSVADLYTLLKKVEALSNPLAEGTALAPLSFFPPASEGVDVVLESAMKRPLRFSFEHAVDFETAVALYQIHGKRLYADVRAEPVRDVLLQAGIDKENFVHLA